MQLLSIFHYTVLHNRPILFLSLAPLRPIIQHIAAVILLTIPGMSHYNGIRVLYTATHSLSLTT